MREKKDRKASIQPIKTKTKLRILDDGDIEAIDETALNILDTIGVHMPLERALKIYADAGANVDFRNQMVRIPPDLVKKSMAGAPRHYTLPGRDRPELDIKLDGQSGTHFINGGCAAKTIGFHTRQTRTSCKDDVAKMARIADYLPIISICWPIVSAVDHPSIPSLH